MATAPESRPRPVASWASDRIRNDTADLLAAWQRAPAPSFKIDTYFPLYAELFGHLRGTACTFVEIGVLNGGSLFMWRDWLGPQARIIGIDMNPSVRQWADHGFEMYIGDQADPAFWKEILAQIGQFDVLLDDGGHQACQQIVTAIEAIRHARQPCLVVVEDTHATFMEQFGMHGERSFLEYSKSSTDMLHGHMLDLFPEEMPTGRNASALDDFKHVHSVQFFAGMVAWRIDPGLASDAALVLNRPLGPADDFRYNGRSFAQVDWPNPFESCSVHVSGGILRQTRMQIIRALPGRVVRKALRMIGFAKAG